MEVHVEISRHSLERMVERGYWRFESYDEMVGEIVRMLRGGKAMIKGDIVAVEDRGYILIFRRRSSKITLKTIVRNLELEGFRGVKFNVSKAKLYTSPILNRVYKVGRKVLTYNF